MRLWSLVRPARVMCVLSIVVATQGCPGGVPGRPGSYPIIRENYVGYTDDSAEPVAFISARYFSDRRAKTWYGTLQIDDAEGTTWLVPVPKETPRWLTEDETPAIPFVFVWRQLTDGSIRGIQWRLEDSER